MTSDKENGLSIEEVKKRINMGLTNNPPKKLTKTFGQIAADNVLTLFNAINVVLFVLLFLVGSHRNLLFFMTVIFNTILGIIQELRAKRAVEKMAVISAPTVLVLREGQYERMHMEGLVLDDVVRLESGLQVCADAVILEGEIELDESLLTGESEPVCKTKGEHLLSGSCVVSGECLAKVENVGIENYSHKLVATASKHKIINSVLMNDLNKILKNVSFAIFPLGFLLFLATWWFSDYSAAHSVVTTAAALVGMIPQGLILLTSIALSLGVVRLARKRVLVQELYSIETLAHVDTICLDKTGTLTEGSLHVEDVVDLESILPTPTTSSLARFTITMHDNNLTSKALAEYLESKKEEECTTSVASVEAAGAGSAALEGTAGAVICPFSSSRKWSGFWSAECGTNVLGAPDILLQHVASGQNKKLSKLCNRFATSGKRVLLFLQSPDSFPQKNTLPNTLVPVALIIMSDRLRADAAETIEYFYSQGVDVKIFSGDNPLTVSKTVEQAGIKPSPIVIDANSTVMATDAEHSTTSAAARITAIDARTLHTPEEISCALQQNAVFGRVTPEQKLAFVRALQREGHTVAMTGDGVNDVMALRAADCGIAMASGSDAARSAANIVLMQDNVGGVPRVIEEGRRVVNNIERSASLFLVKTLFSICLSICFLLISTIFGKYRIAYPFQPLHLTLTSAFTVGLPSFFLALESNKDRIEKGFLTRVMARALPGALTITISLLILIPISRMFDFSYEKYSTICVLITGSTGFMVLFRVCLPFDRWRSVLYACLLCGFISCVFFFRKLFMLTEPTLSTFVVFASITFVAGLVFSLFDRLFRKHTSAFHLFARVYQRLQGKH